MIDCASTAAKRRLAFELRITLWSPDDPGQICTHRSRADRSSDGQRLSFTPGASLRSWNQLRWTATRGYIPVLFAVLE